MTSFTTRYDWLGKSTAAKAAFLAFAHASHSESARLALSAATVLECGHQALDLGHQRPFASTVAGSSGDTVFTNPLPKAVTLHPTCSILVIRPNRSNIT